MPDWYTVAVQVKPDAPLQLGTESTFGNYERTAAVIPGAVLRGVIAGAALEHCTQSRSRHTAADHAACPDRETCPFWQIFDPDHEPLWGFAYPAPYAPAWPFPLTARTCKREPDYPHTDHQQRPHGHGVYDVLAGEFVDDLLTDPEFPQRETLLPGLQGLATVKTLLRTTCPTCGGRLVPAAGYYAWNDQQGSTYAGRVAMRRATHVGINRARGVAEDSLLFTQEVLDVGQGALSFHARVRVPAAVWPFLKPYLADAEYTIGRGRSRGNGRVHILGDVIPTPANVAGRVAEFTQALSGAVNRRKREDPRLQSPAGAFFALTLNSPLILERFGQPRARLDSTDLGLPDAHLLRSWARTEVVGGWDSAARLPRATRLAIQTGSVFVYWTPAPHDDAALLARLAELELTGVGEERPRGYGHVTVCAPFHTLNRLDLQEGSKAQ